MCFLLYQTSTHGAFVTESGRFAKANTCFVDFSEGSEGIP